MGGTGATAYWVCQEAIRNQRKQDAQMRRNREYRKAIRGIGHPERSAERQPFPCANACMCCGWLEPPVPTRDPMRSDPTPAAPSSCPRCGERALADLGDVGVCRALVESERTEVALRSGLFAASLQAVAMVLLGAVAVAGVMIARRPEFFVTSVFVMAGLLLVILRRIGVCMSTPKRTAWRWRAPARRFRATRALARGVVDGDAVVRSPLTGREGIAWRIEVRYPDDRGDAFALVEQDAAPLRIDGESIGMQPSIAIAGAPVDVDATVLRQYLASRGVDPFVTVRVTETIIAPSTAVVVRRDRLGGPVVLCAS